MHVRGRIIDAQRRISVRCVLGICAKAQIPVESLGALPLDPAIRNGTAHRTSAGRARSALLDVLKSYRHQNIKLELCVNTCCGCEIHVL